LEGEHILACPGNILRLSIGSKRLTAIYLKQGQFTESSWEAVPGAKIAAGRMSNCQLPLSGLNCSRYQFSIEYKDGNWVFLNPKTCRPPHQSLWIKEVSTDAIVCEDETYVIGGMLICTKPPKHA
jgi:hypothetical protein